MADTYHFSADIGQALTLTVEYLNADGTPVIHGGSTASLILHETGKPTKVIATFGGNLTVNGLIDFAVGDEVTSLWTFKACGYRVVYSPVGGEPVRLVQGIVTADRGF